jgi:tetratricopeptide (TPR) repeat protein
LELIRDILELPERVVQQALGSLVNLSVLRRPDLSYEISHSLVHTFAMERLVSQANATSFPSSDIVTTWRERFLATLATQFAQRNPYDAAALELWQPHVLSLVSAEHLTAEQYLTVAYLFNQTGFDAFTQGKYADAEPLYVRALAIREQQVGATHPDTALSLNNLALLYATQGKYADAEPLYVRALVIFENILGQNHPNTQTVRANYTFLLQIMEKDREAKQ